MSKILLFFGSKFYPSGGWEDFVGYFDSINAAKDYIELNEPNPSFKWSHIVKNDKIMLVGNSSDFYSDDEESKWIWSKPEDL